MSDDDVRPIPQRPDRRGRPDGPPRPDRPRRPGREPRTERPVGGERPRGPRPPEDDEVYVIDTRGPRTPGRRTPGGRTPGRDAGRTPGRAPARPRPQPVAMPPGSSSQDAGRVVPATRQMPVVPPPRAPRPPAPRPGRRPGRGRRLLRTALLLLLAFLVYAVAVPWHAYSSVTRVDSTPSGQRPSAGKGANYLLVGSDSRAGLSAEQEQELATGQTDGNRSDTIMLLHQSESGMSSLVSIPRDSYVEIPGHGRNKINAAFSLGGPQLLAATVENATGLRLDGYLEIGFGGFAGTVDALGGVDICLDAPMKDDMAGIDLPAGCQTLSGPNALGYVRARYSDPRGDIGRAERQRTFLSAVVAKAARPSTVLNPWRYWDFTHAGAAGIKLGEDTSMSETASMLMTMRSVSAGEGLSLVVPIRTTALQTKAGVAVQWDKERALALFDALKKDEPLTGPPAGTDGQPSAG